MVQWQRSDGARACAYVALGDALLRGRVASVTMVPSAMVGLFHADPINGAPTRSSRFSQSIYCAGETALGDPRQKC